MESKNTIRSICKNRRREMSSEDVSKKSNEICRRILETDCIRDAKQVLVYAAVRNEVNLSFLVEQLWQMGKTVAYPRVNGDDMDFYEVSGYDQLEAGSFGISEPMGEGKSIIPLSDAVILVPGVAFMADGSRIGMGRGYYDRYLSRYPYLYRIGVAYEWQTEYTWKPDTLDIPMNCLVTEHGIKEVEYERRGIMQSRT